MSPDVHVFILWSRAAPQGDRIVADLAGKFDLLEARRVTWSQSRFRQNLRRLYGIDLPERVDKAAGSGDGPFDVYVVRDADPYYELRPRSWGLHPANVKAYDSKQLYREWTGGGFRVHASNEPEEAQRDVFLLFGRTLESYLGAPTIPWTSEPTPSIADPVGADGWASREELVTALAVTVGATVESSDAQQLTLRVKDRSRARQVAAGRRARSGVVVSVAGDPLHVRFVSDEPRRLPRPTLAGATRRLKVRAPRLARTLGRITRPIRRARRAETAEPRATMQRPSSHSGDEPS